MAAPGRAQDTGAHAGLPPVLDLATAVELAVAHNPGLKRTRERLGIQDGRLREIRAGGRPRLGVESAYTVYDERRLQSFGAAQAPDDTRWNAGAEAALTVFSGGRQVLATRREAERKQAVEAELIAIAQDLAAAVHEAYYDALLARETAAVQQDAIRVLEEQKENAQNRFTAGRGTRFDVTQANVAVANARPPLVRAQNDYHRRVDELRRRIGLPFPPGIEAGDIRLEAVEETGTLEVDLGSALATAGEQRPELQDIAWRVKAAQHNVEVTRRENIPLVDLFANYGAESDQFGDEDVLHGWTAGARLQWDFLDGGKRTGRLMQDTAELRRLQYQEEALRLAIGSEVRQAYYDYQEAETILHSTRLVIEQAQEALDLARNRYQAGKGTQIDVLESRLQLTRARLEDTVALNSLRRALVRIKRATGTPL